jgi:hypothetical protein
VIGACGQAGALGLAGGMRLAARPGTHSIAQRIAIGGAGHDH